MLGHFVCHNFQYAWTLCLPQLSICLDTLFATTFNMLGHFVSWQFICFSPFIGVSFSMVGATDMGWSSSLGVGRGANNSSLLKRILLRNIQRQSLGPGLILLYDLSSGGMDWIELAQDRDRWRALVNGVMNLWVP